MTPEETQKALDKSEAENHALRMALEALVGASSREELKAMQQVIHAMPSSAENQPALMAINALLVTMP